MHWFKYIDKDATIYELSSSLNTGIDEILSIQKYISPDTEMIYNSRILLYVDLSSIQALRTAGTITNETYYLNLYTANANSIPLSYTITAYPVTLSWEMGIGTFSSNPAVEDGVSWLYRDGESIGTQWPTISGDYPANTSGSWQTNEGGGLWNTLITASQAFEYETTDIRMDVTSIVNAWHESSFSNEGFILKRDDSEESGSGTYGEINFFSTDTHTIYIPRLEIVWDDAIIATGSATGSATEITSSAQLFIKDLQSEYKTGAKTRFRLGARPIHPVKTFVTQSAYLRNYLLPSESFYSIRDARSDETIVPFDAYSRLSRDSQSSYFNIWLDGFQPERYYRILIKSTIDGSDHIVDGGFTFKVVR